MVTGPATRESLVMTATPGPDAPLPGREQAPVPPPDLPPPAASVRRVPLRRSYTDYVIGGVCGGLADFTGVESFLWRIGFIALAFFAGEGIFVYLVLWLLIPDSDPPPPGSSDAGGAGFVQRLRTGMTRSR